MIIDKSSLKNIEKISLGLENCESFDIESKYIVDIWFDEIDMGVGTNKVNRAYDGRLVLSKNCLDLLSDVAYEQYADGTTGLELFGEDSLKLRNRFADYCDITQVHLFFNDGSKIWFFVPYHTLEEEIHGSEIDMSNCPSAEYDADGNMLILFGKSSHSYKRTDNNYQDLILGFKGVVPDNIKKPLNVKIDKISNVGDNCFCPRIFVTVSLQDKACRNKYLKLVFEDVKNISAEIYPKMLRETIELKASRISTGDIFVEFGNQLHFYCQCIKTYEVYVNRQNDVEIENYTDYKNLLTAEYKKLRDGTITPKDFRFWLKSCSKSLRDDVKMQFKNDKRQCSDALLMDRLAIKLAYCDNYSEYKELIEKSVEEITRN